MEVDDLPGWNEALRRRRSVLAAATGTAVILAVAAGVAWPRTAGGSSDVTPAAPPSLPHPFVCGEAADLGLGAAATQSGITMRLSKVMKINNTAGPELEATFTSEQRISVHTSPTKEFVVLYIRDGVIVGGGPAVNPPGDQSGRLLELVGYGFTIDPDRPATERLGPRDQLCPALTWAQIWAQPQQYQVVLVMGPVLVDADPMSPELEVGILGRGPLLVHQIPLPS